MRRKGPARHDLAGRMFRLPHVLARHRRDAVRTRGHGRIRPLADQRHQALRSLRHRLIEGGSAMRKTSMCSGNSAPMRRSSSRSAPARSTAACRPCATGSDRRHPQTGLSQRRRRTSQIPNDPELPLLLDKVYPIHEVVHVDYFLPGCPPSGDAIWKYLTDLILRARAAPRIATASLRLSGEPT